MRDIQWTGVNGYITKGIAFPCRRTKCKNEVKIDEHHPQYAEFRASADALCNACSAKQNGT